MSYKSKEGQKIKELREQKLDQINDVLVFLEHKRDELINKEKMVEILEDVSKGLYEEADKLFKKSPVETITTLTLNKVNEVIKDTKETADTDIYVQRINMFEAAGDNPEVRDVVLILNQVIKGLIRFKSEIKNLKSNLQRKRHESKLILDCLIQFVEYDLELDKDSADFGKEFPSWFETDDDDDYGYFRFSRLDNLDIFKHFGYEQ